jgi:mycoredoxin
MDDGKTERSLLIVYLTTWCSDCQRVTAYLTAHAIHFTAINIDQDRAGDQFVRETNHGFRSVPTIVFPDNSILVEPSLNVLAEKLAALKTV